MSTKSEDCADFLNELAERNGVACSTVSDGHVLVFTEKALESLLERARENGKVVVFVKRNDMQS